MGMVSREGQIMTAKWTQTVSSILMAAAVSFGALFGSADAQTTWYVDANATCDSSCGCSTNCCTGTSWALAFTELQAALENASLGSGHEVWVAAGTYLPDYDVPNCAHTADRAATFDLKDGVAVYGGFAGNEDPATFDLGTRDFAANETTLSGDLLQDDHTGGSNAENSYNVLLYDAGLISAATLDGFTVTAGFADGPSNATKRGAGLRIGYSTAPVAAVATVSNCRFHANNAVGWGGAVFAADISPSNGSTSLAFDDCRFDNNSASGGGAIQLAMAGLVFQRCVFSRNTATGTDGGAIWSSGQSEYTDCVLAHNTAFRLGGGAYLAWASLDRCVFVGNQARRGGAWSQFFGGGYRSVAAKNCVLVGNSASERGGGIHVSGEVPGDPTPDTGYGGGAPFIVNGIFVGNQSGERGGGAYLDNALERFPNWNSNTKTAFVNCLFSGNAAFGSGTDDGGGGLYVIDQRGLVGPYTSWLPPLRNCTFSGNHASHQGGGIWARSLVAKPLFLFNSVLWANTDGASTGMDVQFTSNYATIDRCSIEDGQTVWTDCCMGQTNPASCVDPTFKGASLPGGTWDNSTACDSSCGGAAVCYDADTFQTTFIDCNAAFDLGALKDRLVNPDSASQYLQTVIVDNTATTITAWGDWTSVATAGDTYELYDYRLEQGSACVEEGDLSYVPDDLTDLDADGSTIGQRTPFDLDMKPRWADEPSILCGGTDTCNDGDPDRTCDADCFEEDLDLGAYEFCPTFCPDADGDGYGDADPDSWDGTSCLKPTTGTWYAWPDCTDCDDSSGTTHLGAAPNDDANACMKDDDGDGWGDSTPPPGVDAGTDCDDSAAAVHPGANEVCNNTPTDDDCDGDIDCDDVDCCGDTFCQAQYLAQHGAELLADCTDGCDNDGNEGADCADSDCFAHSLCRVCCDSSTGLPTCSGQLSGACTGTGYTEHNTGQGCEPTICCCHSNGFVDVLEQCCLDAGAQVIGASCAALPPTEAGLCSNGMDDDCDGQTDCDDGDCAGAAHCEACCEAAGSCREATEADCLGTTDTPMGVGTDCGGTEACCVSAGTCDNLNAPCCLSRGGTPLGPGTSCPPPTSESDCSDGLDNDCDGKVDCEDDTDCFADPACLPCCDPATLTCADVKVTDCAMPHYPGTGVDCGSTVMCCENGTCTELPEACCDATSNLGPGTCANDLPLSEGDCTDGVDNDCDGLADCDDVADCPPAACCGDGLCDATLGENNCGCPGDCLDPCDGVCCAATKETTCSNACQADCGQVLQQESACAGTGSVDEDCDGCVDTEDSDCSATEANCTDGIDNDCDGAIDCADPDCYSDPGCVACCDYSACLETTAAQCTSPFISAGTSSNCVGTSPCCIAGVCSDIDETCCTALGGVAWPLYSTCSGLPPAESDCYDGLDGEDCDGCVDLDDSDCGATELSCSDSVDNECDGCVDSVDADCGGRETDCSPTSGDEDCDGLFNCDDPDCRIRYVNASATCSSCNGGICDGTNWSCAYTALGDAIAEVQAATSACQITELWVADGIYTPGPVGAGGADDTFDLVNGLAIYGGFIGDGSYCFGGANDLQPCHASQDCAAPSLCLPGERSLTQRDPQGNLSILNGEINSNGMHDNVWHVVTSDGNDGTAVLDGFQIRFGYAANTSPNGPRGGGMLILNGGSPTVRDCAFWGNESEGAGGGVFIDGGGPEVSDCTFTSNVAVVGGAMYNDTASPALRACTFEVNQADLGGAMYNRAADVRAVNCLFEDRNEAREGGAIYNEASTVRLMNCLFQDNVATGDGGGAIANGVPSGSGSELEAVNCLFYGNEASGVSGTGEGGGLLIRGAGSTVRIFNSILWGNTHAAAGVADAQLTNLGQSAIVEYSCIMDQGPGDGIVYSGTGNIDENPQFTNTSSRDFHLKDNSPCVDVGANLRLIDMTATCGATPPCLTPEESCQPYGVCSLTLDYEGSDRVRNARPVIQSNGVLPAPVVDMGVYERGLIWWGIGMDFLGGAIPMTPPSPQARRPDAGAADTWLAISNLGSSGRDGVSFDVGSAEGLMLGWIPFAPFPVGAAVETRYLGAGNGAAEAWLGSSYLSQGLELELAVDFSQSGTTVYKVTVYDEGNLVAEFDNVSRPVVAVVGPSSTPNGVELSGVPVLAARWQWPAQSNFTVKDGAITLGAASGSVVEFRSGTSVSRPLMHVELLARDINEMSLIDSRLRQFGHTHSGLGEAHIRGVAGGQRLRIENIGSTGEDGVHIEYTSSLPDAAPVSASLWADWLSLSVTAIVDAAQMAISSVGELGALPEQQLCRAEITKTGGVAEILPDVSPLGTSSYTVTLLNHGSVVASAAGTDVAAQATEWPVGFSTGPAGAASWRMTLRFPEGGTIALTGGARVAADELRIEAVSATVLPGSVTAVELRLADLPPVTIIGESVATCTASTVPTAETIAGITYAKNRFLSFSAGDPGRNQAVRITFVDLPAPFDAWNGTALWVGPPSEVSENSGSVEPVAEFPNFNVATLQCDPHFSSWFDAGMIHVLHAGIVPLGTYDVQVIDDSCSVGLEPSFSAPLALNPPKWGDVCGSFDSATGAWTAPNGTVGVPTDIVSIVDKFRNLPTAPTKARTDLNPATPNLVIEITDITRALDAFRGLAYPFAPGPVPCS